MDIVTLAASRKYTDKKIAESAAVGIKYEIVDSLPSSGEAQTIYFVKNDSSWINNYYDEYVWISSSGSFEKIGSTQLDDFIQNPSAAEVGQTIVVKEVNEEGKPIAWEMADLPEQVQVDATLTQSGQAADAAVVGNRLSALSEEIATETESKVSAHNTGTDTHSDIRLLIQGLADRLNSLADSDDTTLDQLSEIVAYIKSNRSLIEAITTSKVSVADIIDNLTTKVANKPLSAAQGVALKALIDAITIPEALPNPNALTFTGAVTGSYDGSAPVSVEIPSGGGGSVYPVIAMTESSAELLPNTFYRWGEITALTITLGAETEGITNEYCFEFVSGSTATTLTVPYTIRWAQEPSIEAGKTYQVSILNKIGVIVGA